MAMRDMTAVLESLPSASALFDRQGMLHAVNALGRRWFIVDEHAPLDSQSWRVVLWRLHDLAEPLIDAVWNGQPGETRTGVLDIDERVVDLRVAPFGTEFLLVSATDSPAQVHEWQRRTASVAQLDAICAVTPSSVRVADVSGVLLRANAHALAEHAVRRPGTVRELWEMDAPHDVANKRPLPFLDSPGMQALAGMMVRKQILEVRRQESVRVVESYAAPMIDSDGRITGVVLLDQDISAYGTLERTLRERQLAAVAQLAAGVMHDVNNTLNPILAAAYLLRHHAESPEAVRDYADRIRIAAEAGAVTASRVGRFIRQEPLYVGSDEMLDLSALADDVIAFTEPLRVRRSSGSAQVTIERQLGERVETRGLPGEIREALISLIHNAIDAMPEGGRVTVRTYVAEGAACVAVRDTGLGMSAEVRERAFEPFFTTKGARGLGLGLAEVYGIARRHRGTAEITSGPGQGTEITIRLPVAPHAALVSASPTPPAPVSPATPVTTVPQRILVVEDHDDGREFLRRMLTGVGHTVEAVASGEEARRHLLTSSFDLVLTDVGLLDGSGWELVRFVREQRSAERGDQRRELRVGVMTGGEPRTGNRELYGADFVLRKPLRAEELHAHIAGHSPAASTTG